MSHLCDDFAALDSLITELIGTPNEEASNSSATSKKSENNQKNCAKNGTNATTNTTPGLEQRHGHTSPAAIVVPSAEQVEQQQEQQPVKKTNISILN